MIEINASPGRVINIGYEGEDNVTLIQFRYDEAWLSHGAGEFKIRIKRPCDTEAYNATQIVDDREDMTLTMTVTDIELSVKGHGEMQVVYIGSDFVKKSPVYRYNVSRAIDSEVVNPPSGSIINELLYDIGDLSELTTTNKDSLVEAINEINAKEGGGGSVTVDGEMSASSTNPLQNKVITRAFMYALETLSGKADKSYVDTELAGKANAVDVNSALALKANTADVNTALALKANSSDVQTALAGKASKDVATQSANGLMSSADKTKLDSITGAGIAVELREYSALGEDMSIIEIPLPERYEKVWFRFFARINNEANDLADGVANYIAWLGDSETFRQADCTSIYESVYIRKSARFMVKGWFIVDFPFIERYSTDKYGSDNWSTYSNIRSQDGRYTNDKLTSYPRSLFIRPFDTTKGYLFKADSLLGVYAK